MKTFKITVEMLQYRSGVIEIKAKSAEQALSKVTKNISSGLIQTTDVEWDDPEYVDDSFQTTGDID